MNIPHKDRFGKSFGRITIDEFLKRNYPEFREYIDIKYKDSTSTQEKVYRYFNNIENIPLCRICGNPTRFYGYSCGYAKYCSQSCASSDLEVQHKVHDSIVKNYGDNYKNIFKEKSKTSCLEKYGVSNPMQCDEFKEKSRKTCLKRYGVEYTLQTDRVKNKSKETCLEKYGVEYALQSPEIREKIKQTNHEKYGVECPLQSDQIRNKIIKSNNEKYGGVGFASEVLTNKTKQTNIERYGVENYMQSDDYKSHLNKIQDKINNTKRLNNTFSTSKIEEEFESYLNEQQHIEHVRQYKSEKYPFNCDFYVIKYDLYIEIQGTWLHGGHPYDAEKDKEKLEYWKSKQTKFYDNAIETWTIRDVKKRNIAKLNNLNYLEVFSNDINKVINCFRQFLE